MDWPLVGLTAFGTCFALLVAGDAVALLNPSRKGLALARNVAFVASLGAVFALGFAFAGEKHPRPCVKGTPFR